MNSIVIVFNAGSSTLKFKVFDFPRLTEKISGIVERIGLPNPFLTIGSRRWNTNKIANHTAALIMILSKLSLDHFRIRAIGHRIVHGGESFYQPIVVTRAVWRKIASYQRLAPLHNPVNLAVIKACYRLLSGVKNIAVFDTAFYKNIKPEVFLYALPMEYYRRHHIRRYGFHGISHAYVVRQASLKLKLPLKKFNLISCHFGNGSSITAIRKGQPIDTTMGFTPLEGLTMGTRSGDLDPAIPLYLIQKLKMKPSQVSDLLNNRSGLLGVSGFSSDMREILRAAGQMVYDDYRGRRAYTPRQRQRARLALSMFLYDVRRYICAYAGLLGRVDAIIFTGGIGERSSVIRRLSLKGLYFRHRPKILTIRTDEELAIAKEVKKMVSGR